MITSYNSFKFIRGFVQVVADIPHRPGLWPALWMAAANEKFVPEIDILESWGVKAQTAVYFHPFPQGSKHWIGHPVPVALTTGWQTYTMIWTRSKLVYYVGKSVVMTIKRQIPQRRMYFLADLAGYVKPVAGDCNGQLLIRSVRVWKE